MTDKDKAPKIDPKIGPGGKDVNLAHDVGRAAGGSKVDDFNARILETVMPCVWVQPGADGDRPAAERKAMVAAIAGLAAFKPKDEIEGMIAAQAVALHAASMECLRRAMLPQQPGEVSSKLRKDGANMARAMTDMLAALDRKRGKGQQHIRVERVVVHEGGQAIVGDVTTGAVPRVTHGEVPMAEIEGRDVEVGVRG